VAHNPSFSTLVLLWALASAKPVSAESKSASSVFEENRMAIVHIEMQADPVSPNKKPIYGTGFIIGSDGYVLTAKHNLSGFVSPDVTPISVRIGSLDGQQVSADYIPFDVGIDVAMLKLRNPIGVGLTAYRTVKRGDSTDRTKAGNGVDVFIVGFNLTSNISVNKATISSNLGGGTGGNLLWDIQAPGVVFGMSGAPVFDVEGSVVGIMIGGQANTGIAFAYPEQLLENLAAIPKWRREDRTRLGRGGNAVVMDGNVNYDQSGFSFSENKTVGWYSPHGDILVASDNRLSGLIPTLAQFYLPYDVPPYSAPQDASAHAGIRPMGTGSLESISTCPSEGYKYHWVMAEQGGTYCVRMRSGANFVKIKVWGIWKDRIAFDWAAID
jgi:S1-C subfamily serine protease